MKIIDTEKKDEFIVYSFEIEKKDWEKIKNNAFLEVSKNINIQGFRKGCAPENIVRKNITEGQLLQSAARIGVKNLITYLKDFDKFDNDDIINNPPSSYDMNERIGIKEINMDKCVINVQYELMPTFNVSKNIKIKLPKKDVSVSNDEIDTEINRITNKDAMVVDKGENAIAELGDDVNINYTGYLNNEPFNGGSGENHDLILGSKQFIPGFEEQVVGMKVGEKKKIHVTFPDNYHVKELNGKNVEFEVVVNGISNVKMPKLDSEYITEKFKLDGVKTEEQLKKYLEKQIIDWKEFNYKKECQKIISEHLLNHVEIKHIPHTLINNEASRILRQTEHELMQKGENIEQHINKNFSSRDEFYKELTQISIQNIKLALIFDNLIKQFNIKVNKEDINEHFEKLSKLYNMPKKEIEEKVDENTVNTFILQNKLIDKLIEENEDK